MQIQVDIGFDQLVEIVKGLPEAELLKLKQEIEIAKAKLTNGALKVFLMNGPVFTEEQIDEIAKARKAINKWRTKQF